MNKKEVNIAIFASGSGTNAENLIRYFKHHDKINVALVVSNSAEAFVLKRAEKEGVPTVVMDKPFRTSEEKVLAVLQQFNISFIVLAGYLLLVPPWLIKQYPQRIINIHPALLPKYGGKGMYGDKVHEAVIAAGDEKSGITIHYVNEHYDEGYILFQAECPVLPGDNPASLAAKIHQLEYKHFPEVVEDLINQ